MLKVSEVFYSIQGEGVSSGVPAIFIRLGGCNLMCGGLKGKFVKQGKATWWCDTETVWKNSVEMSNEELFDKITSLVSWSDLWDRRVHLVWTGGEPLLQWEGIKEFYKYLENWDLSCRLIYSELETNGTIFPKTKELISVFSYPNLKFGESFTFFNIFQQINCSPKLSNSGLLKKFRIKSSVLSKLKDSKVTIYKDSNLNEFELPVAIPVSETWFKFVINTEDDVKEIFDDFDMISKDKIILMPGVDNRMDLDTTTKFVFEMGKKYKLRTCTRLHVLAWNKLTGV